MSKQITQIIDRYYASWAHGTLDREAFNQAVAPDLVFRGSIDHIDGRDAFWSSVEAFFPLIKGIEFINRLDGDAQSFVLYDTTMPPPVGMLRSIEHFELTGGRITRINLVYDSIALRPFIETQRAQQ